MKSVFEIGKSAMRACLTPVPGGLRLLRGMSRWASGPPHIDPNSRTLLVMVHLPKTGGTSVARVFQRVYGNRFLHVAELCSEWENRSPNPNRILCLSGHFPYGWHAELGARCHRASIAREEWPDDGLFEGRRILYVSVVRDPVDRILSTYRYVQRKKKHRLHMEAVKRSPVEFVQYMEEKGAGGIWNAQFRMLKGLPEDRFFLCAPLSHIGEFVSVLGKALDWPKGIQAPHLNDTHAIRHDPINEELREKIESLVSRDRTVYENVCERFAQRDFPAFDLIEE